MKRILSFAASIAALVLSVASCDMIANTPVFAPASSVAYNGQSMVMHRASFCDFRWSYDENYCTITPNPTINGAGEEAVATFKFPSTDASNQKTLTIVAFNNEDETQTTEQPVLLCKWTLKLYDEEGNVITKAPVGKKVYARMVDLVTDKPVEHIQLRSVGNKEQYQSLVWSSNRYALLEEGYEEGDTYFAFVMKSVSTTFFIKATLGDSVSCELSVNAQS